MFFRQYAFEVDVVAVRPAVRLAITYGAPVTFLLLPVEAAIPTCMSIVGHHPHHVSLHLSCAVERNALRAAFPCLAHRTSLP